MCHGHTRNDEFGATELDGVQVILSGLPFTVATRQGDFIILVVNRQRSFHGRLIDRAFRQDEDTGFPGVIFGGGSG